MIDNLSERLTKFAKLVSRLPRDGGHAVWLWCERCGADLGGVGNRRGVVFANFGTEIRISEGGAIMTYPELVGVPVLILERKINLKCSRCGYVMRWHTEG